MIFLRRLFFYIFAALYFTLCPLLILYALGYAFVPKRDQGLVRTGVISVSSLPEGASVYLNKKKFSQRTPAVMMNLLPGEYAVRVELEGYQGWWGNVRVEAEHAANLEKIVMLPSKKEVLALTEQPVDSFVLLPGQPWAVAMTGSALRDLQLIHLENGKKTLVDAGNHFGLLDEKVQRLYAFSDSRYFGVLANDLQGNFKLERFEFRENPLRLAQSLPLPGAPDWLEWDPDHDAFVFFTRQGNLYRADLKKNEMPEKLASNVRGARVDKGKVYFVSGTGVYRRDISSGAAKPLLQDAILGQELFDPKRTFLIEPSNHGVLFFLAGDGGLFTNRIPYWLVKNKVRGLALNLKLTQAAFWTDTSIARVEFSSGFSLLEDDFDPAIRSCEIFTGGHSIEQVFWVPEGPHWIYRDGQDVFLAQAESPARADSRLLAQVRSHTAIGYDEKTGLLIYVNASSGRLVSQRILPKRELLSAGLLRTSTEMFFEKEKSDGVLKS